MRYGWSLDPKSWRMLELLVQDLAWKKVPFEKIQEAVIPTKPGVYFIVAPTPLNSRPFSSFLNIIYVGLSTTNVRTRFRKHVTNPDRGIEEAKQCLGYDSSKIFFFFTELHSSRVEELEAQLISCLGPPCNRQNGVIRASIGVGRPAG